MGAPESVSFPELSVGRRNHQWGAAKIGLFAYDRTSHQRVWQAGVATGASQARELWVLGIGPMQRGRVYKAAHESLNERTPVVKDGKSLTKLDPLEAYGASIDFQGGPRRLPQPGPTSPPQTQSPQVLPASATAPP